MASPNPVLIWTDTKVYPVSTKLVAVVVAVAVVVVAPGVTTLGGA